MTRNVDFILGGDGYDILARGDYSDKLIGGDEEDTLIGGDGSDKLIGGDGEDTLIGGEGDDKLTGGDGDDILIAGAGNDILVGGDGRDRYVYGIEGLDGGTDQIQSFSTGIFGDVLDLSEALQGASRDNLSDYFEITYNRGSTWLAIDADGDNSGYVDLTIQLKGVKIKSITELEQLILDGNLLISNNFEWQSGDGDRTIDGGPGEDTVTINLDEETSSNVSITPDSDGTIKVTRGDETLTLDNVEEVFIQGTEGADHVVISGDFSGTDLAPNTIFGDFFAGDDIIDASDLTSIHRVVLTGGDGNDTLSGGSGNDRLDGGSGNDSLYGNGGDDWLSGGPDTDYIDGGTGTDTVDYSFVDSFLSAQVNLAGLWGGVYDFRNGTVELERDTLVNIENAIGSDGDDALIGDDRNNILIGGAGNDWISGRAGVDDLRGGDGDDRLFGGRGNDLIDGGAGVDTADYSDTASYLSVQVNLADSWGGVWDFNGAGELERDTLNNIENVVGADGNDALIGNNGANKLTGGAGNDWLSGRAGDDVIIGESGDDVIRGEAGNDTLIGGLGSDDIQGGSGIDTVDYSSYHSDPLNDQLIVDLSLGLGFEDVSGNLYFDSISEVENVTGTSSDDWIKGDDAANRLEGLGGKDQLFGGSGDDVLVGGYGDDDIRGGMGSDTIDYSYLTGAGEQVGVLLSLNQAYEITSEGTFTDDLTGIENIIGSQGADLIVGNSLANRLDGRGGDDLIAGGNGNDVLIGGFGADTLKGNEGSDTVDYSYLDLIGGRVYIDLEQGVAQEITEIGIPLPYSDTLTSIENAIGTYGNDFIIGDDHANRLEGREGDDVFKTGFGLDTVYGGHGFDKLRLSGSYIDYQISGDNTYAVVSGLDEAIDRLYSIEAIEFEIGQVQIFYLDGTPNLSLPPSLKGFTVEVNENTAPGDLGIVSATDPEGKAVHYELSGDFDGTLFRIDPNTGAIENLSPFNFEEEISYLLTVVATDEDGFFNRTEVQVNVIDVNEAAVVEGDKIIAMGADSGPVNLDIKLPVDPEGDPLTVRIDSVPDNGSVYLENGEALSQGAVIEPEDLSGLYFIPGSRTSVESKFTYEVIETAAITPASILFNVAAPANHDYGFGLELKGGAGDDVLVSSIHSDFMTGGNGADTFIFTSGDSGKNVIADFNLAQGDKLNLSRYFSQVNTPDLSQYFSLKFDGEHSEISFDLDLNNVEDMLITLENVDLETRLHDVVFTDSAEASIVERIGPVPPTALFMAGAQGELTFNDADLLDTHHISSIAVPSGALGSLTASIFQDTTLSDSPGVIEWVYGVNELYIEHLAEGETKLEGFKITLSDEFGHEENGEVVVTIYGTNDNPIALTASSTATVTEDYLALNNGDFQFINRDLQETGSFEFGDPDFSDRHYVSEISFPEGNLGYLYASKESDTDGAGGTGVIDWTYSVENSELEYLAEGETHVDSFNITVSDYFGGSFDHSVDIVITGTNDDPELLGGHYYGRVGKIANPDAGRHLYEQGTIAFADVDLTDTHSVSVTSMDNLGSLAVKISEDSTGVGTGVIEWEYSVAAADLESVEDGRGRVEPFTIKLDDGNGGTISETVNVYISGGELIQSFESFTASFIAVDQNLWGGGDGGYLYDDFWGINLDVDSDPRLDLGFGELKLGIKLVLDAGIQPELRLSAGTVNANLDYDIDLNTTYRETQNILSIDTQATRLSGGYETFAGLDFEAALEFYAAMAAYATLDVPDSLPGPNDYRLFTTGSEFWETDEYHIPIPYIGDIEATVTTESTDYGDIYASKGESPDLLRFDWDLFDILFGALGLPNPFVYDVDLYLIDGHLHFFRPELVTSANITQELNMTVPDPPTGTIILEKQQGGVDRFNFVFGDSIEIDNADQYVKNEGTIVYDVEIDPTANFYNDTSLGANLGFEFSFLGADLEYDLGFTDGEYDLGSVWSEEVIFQIADLSFAHDLSLYEPEFELDFTDRTFDFTIGTADGNGAPIVTGGQIFSLDENQEPASLGFVHAEDPDGDRLYFDILSGNNDAFFSINRYTGELFSTEPLNYENDPLQYFLGVEVIDYRGAITAFSVLVDLQNVLEGIDLISAPEPEVSLDENEPDKYYLGTLSANDPDNTAIKYSITSGNVHDLFDIDPGSGELYAKTLDYEQASQYFLTLAATDADGEWIDTKVVVNVNDTEDAPVLANAVFSIDENQSGQTLGFLSASDQDTGDKLSYSIISGNNPALFGIDSDEGRLTVLSPLDYETAPQHDLVVQVTDSGGLSDTATVTININDLPEDVSDFTVDEAVFSTDEDQAGYNIGNIALTGTSVGDLIYEITDGNTGGRFEIDSDSGSLWTIGTLDYELKDSYTLTVQATDSNGFSDSAEIIIDVIDINEAPSNQVGGIVYSDSIGMRFAENLPAGQFIRDFNLHDPEGEAVSYSIAAGNDDELFAVDSNGVVTTTGPLDYEYGGYSLTVRASDPTGLYTDRTFSVSVNNVLSKDLTETVDENSGEVLLGSVAESDSDTDVTYAITSGNDDGLFRVDETGKVWTTGDLDYETQASHEFIVSATDGLGASETATVTVSVNDLVEGVSPITAYDSKYYYHTSTHSILDGLALINPLDGSRLNPTVLTEGGANNYTVDSSVNGTGSFTESNVYEFAVTAAFETTDSTGSFIYSADNGGIPAQASVEVKSFTATGDQDWLGGDGNDVFVGGNGNDRIQDTGGDDIIFGGDGNELIQLKLSEAIGSDFIDGGDGTSDTVEYRTHDGSIDINFSIIPDIPGGGTSTNIVTFDETQIVQNTEVFRIVDYMGGDSEMTGTISGDFSSTGISRLEFSNSSGNTNIDASGATNIHYIEVSTKGATNFIGHDGYDVFGLQGGINNSFNGGGGNDVIVGLPRMSGAAATAAIVAHGGNGRDQVQLQFGSTSLSTLEVVAGTDPGEIQMTMNGSVSYLTSFEWFNISDSYSSENGQLDITFSGDFTDSLGDVVQSISGYYGAGVINLDASGVTSLTPFGANGGPAADTILTGAGNDNLYGNDGNDVLNGRKGADTLTGGTGSDRFIFDGQAFSQLLTDPDQKDTVTDYESGEIFDLSGIFDYVVNTLAGQIDSVENDTSSGTGNGALRVNYSDSLGSHSVVLADLTGYTGDISFEPPLTSNLTAYDSVFYYATDAGYSLTTGINLTDPLGNPLAPSVRVDGGANNYTVVSYSNGTGSFSDSASPAYDFVVNAAFEAADSTGSFIYSADNGGTPVEGTVTVQSFNGNTYVYSWNGGAGNDVFVGGATGRQVYAGEGNDIILGSSATDRFYGESGDDVIYGFSDRDHFYGGEGNDMLYGGAGDDSFYYQPGAASGNDFVDGDEGYNHYYIIPEDTDETVLSFNANGGEKLDIVAYGQTQTVQNMGSIDYNNYFADFTPDLTATLSGDFSELSLLGLTFLRFNSEGYTNIDASGSTGKGIEVTANSGSADFIGGGAGDTFYINDGASNTFYGGAGDDLIRITDQLGVSYQAVTADGGEGSDLVQLWLGRDDSHTIEIIAGDPGEIQMSLNGQVSQLTSIERFDLQDLGSIAAHQIDITFSGDFTGSLQYQSIGMSGSAINLDASRVTSISPFYSYGGSSADTLITGAGNDILSGGAGNDQLAGGIGNDKFLFGDNWGNDVINDFGDGLDRLYFGQNTSVNEFTDLSINQTGDDTEISITGVDDGDTITLLGVDSSQLTSDDFSF